MAAKIIIKYGLNNFNQHLFLLFNLHLLTMIIGFCRVLYLSLLSKPINN